MMWAPGTAPLPPKAWSGRGIRPTRLRREAGLEPIVFVTKMRWRIERDYQELRQEFGLRHDEGRGWQGFHRHATHRRLRLLDRTTSESTRCKKTSHGQKRLPFPTITPLAAAGRLQRRVHDSTTTLRLLIASAICSTRHRCPCCWKAALNLWPSKTGTLRGRSKSPAASLRPRASPSPPPIFRALTVIDSARLTGL